MNKISILLALPTLCLSQYGVSVGPTASFGTSGVNAGIAVQADDPNPERSFKAEFRDGHFEEFEAKVDRDQPDQLAHYSFFSIDKSWEILQLKNLWLKTTQNDGKTTPYKNALFGNDDFGWTQVHLVAGNLCYAQISGDLSLFQALDQKIQSEKYYAQAFKSDTSLYNEETVRNYLSNDPTTAPMLESSNTNSTVKNVLTWGGLGLAGLGFLTSFSTSTDFDGTQKSEFKPSPLLVVGGVASTIGGLMSASVKNSFDDAVSIFNANHPYTPAPTDSPNENASDLSAQWTATSANSSGSSAQDFVIVVDSVRPVKKAIGHH